MIFQVQKTFLQEFNLGFYEAESKWPNTCNSMRVKGEAEWRWNLLEEVQTTLGRTGFDQFWLSRSKAISS